MYTTESQSKSAGGVFIKSNNNDGTSSDISALLIEQSHSDSGNVDNANSNKTGKSKSFIYCLYLLLLFIVIIITAILSNIDRIIDYFSDLSSSTDESGNSDDLENTYDVIVVGGGATGLHAMHFLDQHENTELNYQYKKLLIERLPRIGGNTLSHSISYNDSNIVFEMGAMRFERSDYYMSRMMKRMDLCADFVQMDSNNGENQYYYYRNEWGKIDEATNENYWIPLYNFDKRDENWILNGTSIDTLNDRTRMNIYLENNNGLEPSNDEEWYLFRNNWTLQGIPLTYWSYEAYLKYYLNFSMEYFDYTEDRAFSFYRDRQLSAYLYNGPSLAPAPAPTPDQEEGLWTLKNGYLDLQRKILDNITSYENNDVWLGNELIAIDYADNVESYTPYFKYKVSIKDHMNNSNIQYAYCNHIILAMNPLALQTQLPYFRPIDNEKTRYIVDSVTVSKVYKVNLIFNSEINNFMKSTVGSTTDLAIRSYLIESVWTDNDLTALQIYATGNRAELLHRLQSMGKQYGMNELISTDLSDGILIATEPVVFEVIKEIELLLSPLNYSLPTPLAAFVQPLGTNISNGDGLYSWKVGHFRDFVYDNIWRPNQNENIYIGSSYFSERNSWQYGSIWSAIQLIKHNFNMTYNPLEMEDYDCSTNPTSTT